jgi:hypothetical protein
MNMPRGPPEPYPYTADDDSDDSFEQAKTNGPPTAGIEADAGGTNDSSARAMTNGAPLPADDAAARNEEGAGREAASSGISAEGGKGLSTLPGPSAGSQHAHGETIGRGADSQNGDVEAVKGGVGEGGAERVAEGFPHGVPHAGEGLGEGDNDGGDVGGGRQDMLGVVKVTCKGLILLRLKPEAQCLKPPDPVLRLLRDIEAGTRPRLQCARLRNCTAACVCACLYVSVTSGVFSRALWLPHRVAEQ